MTLSLQGAPQCQPVQGAVDAAAEGDGAHDARSRRCPRVGELGCEHDAVGPCFAEWHLQTLGIHAETVLPPCWPSFGVYASPLRLAGCRGSGDDGAAKPAMTLVNFRLRSAEEGKSFHDKIKEHVPL